MRNNDCITNKKSNHLYCDFGYIAFFVIISFGKGIGLDFNDKEFIFLGCLAVIFLIVQIIIYKYKIYDILKMFFWGILSWVIYLNAGKVTVSISIITIILIKNIRLNRLINIVFISRLIGFIGTIIFSLLGIIGDKSYTRFSETGQGVVRHALGFSHPNIVFLNFFILVLLYIYIKDKKIRFIDYFFMVCLSVILYKVTYSRTGLICVLLTIFFSIFFSKVNLQKNIIIKKIIIIMPCTISIGSILLCYFYNHHNKVMRFINDSLTGRVELGHRFLVNYGIKPFGQSVIESSNLNGYYLRIDNGYISLLLVYGIVSFLLFILIETLLLRKFLIENRHREILLTVMFLIYGISETYIYNVFINISLIFLSELLFEKNNKIFLTSRINKKIIF